MPGRKNRASLMWLFGGARTQCCRPAGPCLNPACGQPTRAVISYKFVKVQQSVLSGRLIDNKIIRIIINCRTLNA